MEDYRLDQSGQEVQEILNGAAMQSDLTAETERATEAEQTLQDNIDAEATRAQGAEGTLQDNIDAEEARAKAAEKQNADDIDAIEEKIPSGASSSNKLATEEYVADAVATATATFRGTYNLVSDLHLNVTATEQQIAAALAGAISTADNNDYCFILVPTLSETPTEIKEIDRYKFNGTAWAFEYKLNNSGFTAVQWAAINSGITSGDVAKLAALPTNAQLTTLLAGLQSGIDGEEARAKAAELAIQGNIDAEKARAKAAEKQNADDIDAIEAVLPETASSENKVATESEIDSLSAAIEAILLLIPSAATSLNKLADKAFVNSSIATATATFRGTYNLVNDLGLTTSATHAQIATALAGAILTADNNDYAFVQIPTSDAMPTEIAKTERYKFNGTAWEYEYDLNNSGFTADQWAAINSGITQALVTKLAALPTNAELTTELGTLTSSITAINQKIPAAASQANKLVDTAAMEAYVVEVLNVLTISYNVTSTDGHVTLSIEQVDGKITYVTLTTSDIASAADLNLKASQADLTALASRVTTAESNITTLGGRMTTAEGNITTINSNITSLGGRMTTAESNITSLGGRVSTNETDIANLQQLYNDLQQSKPVPVTALPETGQQQGVIYRLSGTTSYSDYMWNGSTWVLMATYNNAIDPRPKKASQNLVTSGGVFDNMGALDVSELNATENPHTIAQYVDLSAALAAIPTDYQKGGMSIKFVHSSDNNYVQYRCIPNEFSTNPEDWAIYSENTYNGNPQYKKVLIDNKGQIISAIDNNMQYFFLPMSVPYVNTETEMFLDKEKSFAEQIIYRKKKYIVADDFDLDGQSVYIQSGTILSFVGGSISNGIIKGDNIIIEGEPKFVDIEFIGSYSCDEYDFYSGNILATSNVNLHKIYQKGTFVEISIKNFNYTSSWEPNVLLKDTVSEQTFILGYYKADCNICAETIFNTNTLRFIHSGDDYSYECKIYKKTTLFNKDIRIICKNISPADYTYCQVISMVANEINGNVYGCFTGSKSTYNEQDFNVQYDINNLDNGVDKNPKKVVLFKKTNGFSEVEYVEVTRTIGQEATDDNCPYVRMYQNTNILLYNGYINILTEGIKKSDGTRFIGYYHIPENTLEPPTDILTPCTLDGVEFNTKNIPSIVSSYGIVITFSKISYWLPQSGLAKKDNVYYQCFPIKLIDQSYLNIIIKTSDGGLTWESVHAFINYGDESAICIKGNDMYIVQRQSAEVLKFNINTKTFYADYKLNVIISTMRPFAFLLDNVPYIGIGFQHQFMEGGIVFYRFGYAIINALDGSYVKYIYDVDGFAYCAPVVLGYGLIVAYTSCKRFKGEQTDYIIGYDEEEQPIYTYQRPILGCCSDCQIAELSLY